MLPFAIVVLTFRDDELLRYNVQSIKDSNPGVPVEIFSSNAIIPGEGHISRCGAFAERWKMVSERKQRWRGCWGNSDLLTYAWWMHERRTQAERWLLLEYDAWCNIEIKPLYESVWDADIVVPTYVKYPSPWSRFREYRRMPDDLRPLSAGIVPMTALLFKPSALDQLSLLAAQRTDVDLFGEYRMGTFAHALGLDVRELPMLRETIHWLPFKPNHPGLWHPVKTVGPWPDANELPLPQ